MCRDDQIARVELSGVAVEGHLSFLHHFEERRLGFGRSAVDFVDEEHLCEDRSRVEIKLLCAEVEDRGAQDVGRHEVGGELHAAKVGTNESGEGFGQEGFGHTGHAFEQHVAVGHERCEEQMHGQG